MGCASDLPLRTPNLDALAARGTRFSRCYTPSPVCSPARACLATGRGYTRAGVLNNQQNTPLDLPNHYRMLRDSGYEVAGFGKFDLHKPDLDWGLEGQNQLPEYGFTSGCDNEGKGDGVRAWRENERKAVGPYLEHLDETDQSEGYVALYEAAAQQGLGLNFHAISPLKEDSYCDNWIGAHARKTLEGFDEDRPWYMVVNFTGPHDPYDILPEMAQAWDGVEFPRPHHPGDMAEEEVQTRRRYYAAMIENIDRQVGLLWDAVVARGEAENTIVVYSSDHGEMLGDHGRWQKGVSHEGSSHIPLLMAGPGIP